MTTDTAVDASPTGDPQDREDARAAYAAAISLWAYEGDSAWARFNAMLVANSLVLTAIGFVYDKDTLPHLFRVGLPFFGLAFCAIWLILNERAFSYQKYWVVSAREIEERLGAVAQTVTRGADFSRGRAVLLRLGGTPTKVRLSWLGRISVTWCSRLMIVAFAAMYGLFIYSQ